MAIFWRDIPALPHLYRSLRILLQVLCACGLILSMTSSCGKIINPAANHLQIQVFISAPVVGAEVFLWWVDEVGRPMNKDGEPHGSTTLSIGRALAHGVTDENGVVVFDGVRQIDGTFVLMARGGSYTDPWLAAEEGSGSAIVPLPDQAQGFALWSVVTDYVPPYRSEPTPVVISPLTTVAKALGDYRVSSAEDAEQRGDGFYQGMRASYALLGNHFSGIELTEGPLPNPTLDPVLDPADPPSLGLDEQASRGMAIAAFASLAREIGQAAGIPSRSFHAIVLIDLLVDDATSDGLLDGRGSDGAIVVGVCEPPAACVDDTACRAPCALDSNTLRGDLAAALAFGFLPTELNRTGLTLADVLPLIEYMRSNQNPELFGSMAPVLELGGKRPALRLLPTSVHDEAQDTIAFDEQDVPVHTSDAPIALGGDGSSCPVIHKYVHRLDEPDDNAIRWEFEVVDERGAAIEPAAGAYRLRLRESVTGDPQQAAEQWLTDWLPASAVESIEAGVRYEVVLLRSQVPALGATRGVYEIEFRGADEFGLETRSMQRCWEHIPLAAPLRVRNVGEAVGEGALHENNLETGNNLAPLINGVALEQGRAVMELDVVNGTAETVYVTLGIEQALATFRKSWQKTNAFLFPGGASGCLGTGDCTFGFPPDKRTVVVSDETGTVTGLVSGLVIRDVLTGQRIEPCDGCDPGEYRFEPRVALGNPRVYRIRLVVTDLGFLAPQPIGVNFGPFADLPLDAEVLPSPITGRTFGRVRECRRPGDTPFECESELVHQHYLALTETSLSLPWLRVSARTSPIPELPALFLPPQPELFSGTLAIESYQWETAEQSLPPPPPAP